MNKEKRLKKLADMLKDKDLSTLENFMEIQEKQDEHSNSMAEMMSDIKEMKDKPDMTPETHKKMEEMHKEMMDKIDEPMEVEVELKII